MASARKPASQARTRAAEEAPRKLRSHAKCTPETTRKMAGLLTVCVPIEVACTLAGISPTRHHEWMRLAQKPRPRPEHVAYKQAIDDALANAEKLLVGVVARSAAKGEWRSASWLLERRFKQRWSARVETAEAPPVAAEQVDLTQLDDDELDQLEQLAAKAIAKKQQQQR